MSERTRADTNDERTTTDVSKESEGWTESDKSEAVDAAAESGYRPGDQVTEDMMETMPVDQSPEGGGPPEEDTK